MYSLLYIGYHYQYYYFLSQPLCLANNNGPLLHIPMHQLAVKVEAYPHPVQQQHQHYCPFSTTTMTQHDPPFQLYLNEIEQSSETQIKTQLGSMSP